MIRIHNIKIPLDHHQKTLIAATAKKLGVPAAQITGCSIAKKSVDARKKNDVCFVMSLDVQLKNAGDERRIAARLDPSAGGLVKGYVSAVPLRLPFLAADAGFFCVVAIAIPLISH